MYNHTDKRIFEMAVNGRNPAKKHIKIVGLRACPTCNEVESGAFGEDGVKVEIESTVRLWSLASSWTHEGVEGKVPIAGDSIEIKAGWNMVYDLADSPIFKIIIVNGRLTFLDDPATAKDLKL